MLGPLCPSTGTLTPALTTVSSPWEPRTGKLLGSLISCQEASEEGWGEGDGEWLMGCRENDREEAEAEVRTAHDAPIPVFPLQLLGM